MLTFSYRRSVTCNTCILICLGIRLTGVSVLNMLKTSDNSTTRDILVMFSELGVTFRVLANKEVLNVMPIIDKNRLEGIKSGTSQTLGVKPHLKNLGPFRKAQCIPDKKYLGLMTITFLSRNILL